MYPDASPGFVRLERLPLVVVVRARGNADFTGSFTSKAATRQRNSL